MKYYIIAGEASGDLHGSNLMHALKKEDEAAEFRCWGGDLMCAAGGEIVKHYKELAFMGFVEVVMNLRTVLGNIKHCKEDIQKYRPDAVILIDYPGFNMRIGPFVKSLGIKVYYYISPQIWAWKQNRGYQLKKWVDRMFVILPFEREFYKKFGMDVNYVGHPLLDAIHKRDNSEGRKTQLRKALNLDDKPIVAVLPGSRKQEISMMLPIMLKQSSFFKNHQFVVAAAPSFDKEFYVQFLKDYPNAKMVSNKTYDLLELATAAMVTSGTATLETALFQVPEVVCYKGSFISYQIAKRLIKTEYISLVNLIMNEEIVKELIQSDLSEKLLRVELGKLLEDNSYRVKMLSNFELLIQKLGGGGASKKTAQLMVADLKS